MSLLGPLLAIAHGAVVANDEAGRIRLFNPAAERLWGYRAEEALAALHVSDLFERPGDARKVSAALAGGTPQAQLDTQVRARTGESIPVRLRAARGTLADGTPVIVGAALDRRETLDLLARLEDATGQVLASERRAAGIQVAIRTARELAQPLTAALGHLEMLQDLPELSAEARNRAQRARVQLERIGRLAADLVAHAPTRDSRSAT
jgi:PAS domain S-box-containing protein